ncbi:unnamed protein product [Ceratitis capitata]|uniref:(Mediterranean fruit fly) hypothetical protein n=1 Tax=Ceratitis capitata TaxID=7213 RepID=A0A811V0N1_CERCA|nr:unnamed protein product [Ceratitis capitata]
MPFIDDALLWCPDNDGRMVGGLDIGHCMQEAATGNNNENGNEPAQLDDRNTELNSLEPLCNESSDELFRQLSESNFEIESLLSDLATVEVKEENNNNIAEQVVADNFVPLEASAVVATGVLSPACANTNGSAGGGDVGITIEGAAESTLLALTSHCESLTAKPINQSQKPTGSANIGRREDLRGGNSYIDSGTQNAGRFLIASNPLLAEKLLAKSIISADDSNNPTVKATDFDVGVEPIFMAMLQNDIGCSYYDDSVDGAEDDTYLEPHCLYYREEVSTAMAGDAAGVLVCVDVYSDICLPAGMVFGKYPDGRASFIHQQNNHNDNEMNV